MRRRTNLRRITWIKGTSIALGIAAVLVCVIPQTVQAHRAVPPPGQGRSDLEIRATAARLTRELRAAAEALRSRPASAPRTAVGLVALTMERREALEALVEEHPGQVAQLILPPATRRLLATVPGAWVEQRVTIRGRYGLVSSHDNGSGAMRRIVSQDGRTVVTVRGARPGLGIRPNASVVATGFRVGGVLLARPGGIESLARPAAEYRTLSSTTVGPINVAVIVGTFSDSSTPVDLNAIRGTFQGSPGNDVVSFFAEASYGRQTVAPSFFGPYVLPATSAQGCASPSTQALISAASTGVQFSSFSRLVFVFNCPGHNFGSAGSVGPLNTPQGTVQAAQIVLDAGSARDPFSVVHEISHTLGSFNRHAAFDICSPEPFIPPTRWDEGCVSGEYGDPFDVLGGPPSGQLAHLDPHHKANAGWFGSGEYPTVTTSGTFRLSPYERTSPTGQPLALNIPRGQSGTAFTVEYRQALGFDTWMGSQSLCPDCAVTDGASIRIIASAGGSGGGSDTQLLDTTPGTIASNGLYPVDDGRDGALRPGRTFTDPEYGITITTVAADASGLTVQVVVPPQTCVHGTPTVSATSPAGQTGTVGSTSTYSVTLTNTDSPGCAANTFRYLPYDNPSLSMVADPDFVSLAAGASTTVSLTVGALPLTSAGIYTATGVFRSNTPGTGDGNVSASYTLTSASDAIAPAAPGTLTATALGATSVRLTWAPSADNVGVVGYTVTRDGGSVSVEGTTITDTGLTPGTSYSYSVRGFDRRGNVSAAATVTLATPLPVDVSPPTAPMVGSPGTELEFAL